ncbi:hypothetical protein WME76_46325 (plasmid) [Sorangium sp. So ce119]|uniref:hypothetical protein n=1 Tax=Sorangium sp. So ce119 TaxID=3133279 RepID=UPI003F64891B
MRPSLPFVCKSCRAKSKQAASDRAGGTDSRPSPSGVPSSASGRDRREPSSEPERSRPSSVRALEPDHGLSGDLLDAESTLPGAGIQRRTEPAGGPPRRAGSGPAGRARGLTLAERIAQQDLGDEPGSGERAPSLDALDVAAEASLEHAVVTPDGGLGRREILMRSRTFAGASWDDARRSGSAPPTSVRSPSALPPADSDPVSIQDLAQMLSPGVEPPSLSFGSDPPEDDRASRPAPAPEAAPRLRSGAPAPVPVRPPARREHRTPTARPRSTAAPRASGSSRPIMPPSEMPPAPLSELPPAPLSIDEGRPSSHRSSPELRLQDVQAMAALAPQPLPSTRRARSGAMQPADSSPADLALLGSLTPPPSPGPPPLPGPPPFPGPPPLPATEASRRERARPRAAEAKGAAGAPREPGNNDERPSREPPTRASSAPRVASRARGDGDRISQPDVFSQPDARGRAGRKEDSGLIDLRSMAPPPSAEDGERRNEHRADEEILSISGGLFEGAAAARSSSPSFPAQSIDPDLMAADEAAEEDAASASGAGQETPVRTSITAASLVSEGLRALSTPTSRQYLAITGWVVVVFVVFGAALYFAQARGRSSSAATAQVAPADSAGALAAPPPDQAPPSPAPPAQAAPIADREPSLDDEPVEAPPAAASAVAEQPPSAPEPSAAPPPEPAGTALAAAPEPAAPPPSAAPATAAPSPSAAPPPAAPSPSAAPPATAQQASEKPQAAEKPALAAAPSAPDRAKPAGKQPPPAPLLPARDAPARFDPNAASSALASAAAAAAGCTGEGLTGTARVAVTFATSGKAMSSRVEGGDLVGTATAACIANAFRNISVPPFEGIPVTVMKQVKIR